MTVVNRRTFIIKRGHVDEALAMLKGEGDRYVTRVYQSYYGAFDTVALEIEFPSMAEMEQAWTEWFASDRGKEFMPRWHEITEVGGKNEVWLLA